MGSGLLVTTSSEGDMVLRNAVLVGFIIMYLRLVSGLKVHLIGIDIDSVCSISRCKAVLFLRSVRSINLFLVVFFWISLEHFWSVLSNRNLPDSSILMLSHCRVQNLCDFDYKEKASVCCI